MNLQEFKNEFDFEGAIVLLEGKRKVLDNDKEKLIALGKLLSSSTSPIVNHFIPLLFPSSYLKSL